MSMDSLNQSIGDDLADTEYTHPGKAWNGLRRKARWEVDGMPPLQSFTFELNVLRTLLRNPVAYLYLDKWLVLDANRYQSAKRVARAALREGHSSDSVVQLLLKTHADYAPPGYHFIPYFANEIVKNEGIAQKTWVMYPGGRKGCRIIGVCA